VLLKVSLSADNECVKQAAAGRRVYWSRSAITHQLIDFRQVVIIAPRPARALSMLGAGLIIACMQVEEDRSSDEVPAKRLDARHALDNMLIAIASCLGFSGSKGATYDPNGADSPTPAGPPGGSFDAHANQRATVVRHTWAAE
jgi:hypothetical protein